MTAPPTVAPPPGGATDPARHRGSLSLEMALVLPLAALVLGALLQGVGVLGDVLIAQEAARVGARVAATTGDDAAVSAAVADATAGRDVRLAITPPRRGPGTTITVQVWLPVTFGPWQFQAHGRSVSRGEPVLAGRPS